MVCAATLVNRNGILQLDLNYITFKHGALRTFLHDGARRFVLPDVCGGLGIDTQEVATRLAAHECTAVVLRNATDRHEVVLAVTVSSLPMVLAHGRKRSRKKAFKRWTEMQALLTLLAGDHAVLPRSDDEIVLLPPGAEDDLFSTTQVADRIGYDPGTLTRLVRHLKAAQHGQHRPSVGCFMNIPFMQWYWN